MLNQAKRLTVHFSFGSHGFFGSGDPTEPLNPLSNYHYLHFQCLHLCAHIFLYMSTCHHKTSLFAPFGKHMVCPKKGNVLRHPESWFMMFLAAPTGVPSQCRAITARIQSKRFVRDAPIAVQFFSSTYFWPMSRGVFSRLGRLPVSVSVTSVATPTLCL